MAEVVANACNFIENEYLVIRNPQNYDHSTFFHFLQPSDGLLVKILHLDSIVKEGIIQLCRSEGGIFGGLKANELKFEQIQNCMSFFICFSVIDIYRDARRMGRRTLFWYSRI